MPAKLKQPVEVIEKKARYLTDYAVHDIFINLLEGIPYARITYSLLDGEGKEIRQVPITLMGKDLQSFISNNPVDYNNVKAIAYKLGKDSGLIPVDAEVS